MPKKRKKGSFVEESLQQKIRAMNARGEKRVLKTWSRSSTVTPEFVGHTVAVHNGDKFIPVHLTEQMVGHRLGELAPTRTFKGRKLVDKYRFASRGTFSARIHTPHGDFYTSTPTVPSPTSTPEKLATIADYQRARRGFATDASLAEVLGVHRTRLAAWKRGIETPTPENARLLSHVAVTVTELGEFLDPEVIHDWLLTEQITLGGRTPAESLREGRLAEVLYAANASEHGAYT